MEKHLVCAYCGKEYVAINNTDCCPYCGSFNEFTITTEDKFLSHFKKSSKIFKIIAIIILLIIIFSGLKNFIIHIWYQNEIKDVQFLDYYYTDDYIDKETSYLDKTKKIDETIKITVDGENYEDIISLVDEFIPNQFYQLDLSFDLDNTIEVDGNKAYIEECNFYIYNHFIAFGVVVDSKEKIDMKDGKLLLKDINNNLYLIEIKKDFSDASSLKNAFNGDFIGQVYGYLEDDIIICNEGVTDSSKFIKFQSIIFEIDGKEYECPINYEDVYNASICYWGLK